MNEPLGKAFFGSRQPDGSPNMKTNSAHTKVGRETHNALGDASVDGLLQPRALRRQLEDGLALDEHAQSISKPIY